jgi:HK97 family phage prohead protease
MYKGLITEIKDIDEKGIVTVAANAIGNVDSQKDMSLTGSFQKTITENFQRLKWFLNHNQGILLGVPLEAKEMNPYLQIRGQLNMKKEVSRDVYEDYKLYSDNGRTLEHSIGVDAIKHKMVGDIRHVSEWKLWEFSTLTSWGANEDTPLLSIKSHYDLIESINWLELKMKKGNYTDQKFVEIQKTINHLRSLSLEPGFPTHIEQPGKLQFSLLN